MFSLHIKSLIFNEKIRLGSHIKGNLTNQYRMETKMLQSAKKLVETSDTNKA